MASPSKPPPESSSQKGLQHFPLLGLRLNKTDSFVYEARTGGSQKPKPFRPPARVNDPQADLQRRERLKAANIPATLISIGSWQFATGHEANLVAKFYFATRKLVWEVFANGVKNKMEIQWPDISAIKATIEENKPGILKIEVAITTLQLHQPPTFHKEINPQPRHHSIWISADDFTGGQALTCRRHYIEFPSAALDKSYLKLLYSDRRLLELSWSGFPSSIETTFCTSQHFNSNEYPPRLAKAMPQAHQVLLQSAYPPVLTPQRRRSYEAAIQQALLWKDSTPPMSELDSQLLEHHRLENAQMTPWDQVSNNFSEFKALPPLRPAAAAGPVLYLREDLYPPHVGEAEVPTLQTPAITRNTQRRLFSDPISLYYPRLLPANHGTFASRIGSPSAIGSASNGDAMGVRQEHKGYAKSSGEFINGPLEHHGNFASLLGTPSAVGSGSNGVAVGVRREHDGYADSSRQFIMCPPEQNGTFTSQIASPSAIGSESNGTAMGGCAKQNGTVTSPIGSFPAGSASHVNAMGVRQEPDGYASSVGPSECEGQIYEQLAPLMDHQAYEQKPQGGSPWK